MNANNSFKSLLRVFFEICRNKLLNLFFGNFLFLHTLNDHKVSHYFGFVDIIKEQSIRCQFIDLFNYFIILLAGIGSIKS